ncbi:hypothetical protein [Saccharothrix algeriensis]|uniref:Secreted protein n=1 Tax=Saccharothrix algeriensis TaxID=173560 RepID=A0A8T8HSV1_9PSEU|nr:hypothetical protein [Saccharothrix algeriensis]MBM7812549.1 hypothetical protein [Saccharothrix algeriensis]QTR01280.1 hypothetical protein J7S33_17570 [Saccharothrix algeriensis]
MRTFGKLVLLTTTALVLAAPAASAAPSMGNLDNGASLSSAVKPLMSVLGPLTKPLGGLGGGLGL